jgi:hypothetical protein
MRFFYFQIIRKRLAKTLRAAETAFSGPVQLIINPCTW